MKMRKLTMALLLASALQASAQGMKTAGNGTVYTLDMLSQIEGMQIDKYVDEDDGEIIYSIYATDTIAAGDKFVMDDGVSLLFDDHVALVIEGEADFRLSTGSTFDSAFDDADYVSPIGIIIANNSVTEFSNCTFYYVGLRGMSDKGMKLTNCNFYNNNGAIGQAALTMSCDGAPYELRQCTFDSNQKAAIAGAANYYNPLLIEDCLFSYNGQANGNTPQLNLTVASSVVVRNCTIEGDPTKDKVGGIVVANLLGRQGDMNTLIENNTITNCRFGIATYLWQKAVIRHNTLKDNCHETNPMNGGSGINVYDPYQQQITRIEGNHIEGSLWGVTLVGGKEANLGHTDLPADDPNYNPGANVFVNNGNSGQLYDLYNNSTNTVYAQGNTWNVSEQTQEQIETVIFHKNDDPKLGEVIYMSDTNAIVGPSAKSANTLVYTLQGHVQKHAARQGLYIMDGKKRIMNYHK